MKRILLTLLLLASLSAVAYAGTDAHGGAVTIASDLTVSNNITATGNGNFNGTFNADGATTLGSTVAITGATTCASTLTITGHLSADDQIGALTTRVQTTVFQAASDGFLVGYLEDTVNTRLALVVYVEAGDATPDVTRAKLDYDSPNDGANDFHSFNVPIRKSEYYSVTATNESSLTMLFVPLD